MKIKPDDYAKLKTIINKAIDKHLKSPYVMKEFKCFKDVYNFYIERLSITRLSWDLISLSKIKIGDGIGVKGDINLYAYMNDTHINTALKSIIKERIRQ